MSGADRCKYCGAPIEMRNGEWVHTSDGERMRTKPVTLWKISNDDGGEFWTNEPLIANAARLLGSKVSEMIFQQAHHEAVPKEVDQ